MACLVTASHSLVIGESLSKVKLRAYRIAPVGSDCVR
jgi:hypothetical protein